MSVTKYALLYLIYGNLKASMLQVVLGIPQRAMYLSESNFKRAGEFIPERWLGDSEFAGDRRDCLNPFSVGPRNCIGVKCVKFYFY